MMFPIPFIPSLDWRGGRGFGADRSRVAKLLNIPGGKLKHGACDLVVPHGTPVLAMEDGVIVRPPYKFFLDTWAIEVQHGAFLARYCEIDRKTEVKSGCVRKGQVIAYVGNQPGGDMLHLELFKGTESGDLTTARTAKNAPYYRRKDLMDPTPILDSLRGNVIREKSKSYNYITDGDGRKFLKPLTLADL